MNNKKEVKLINKVKRLLRRLGCPRYLHRFGPKTYEFYEHICALLMRWYCRLSYRRVVYLLGLVGIKCPSKSALQYTAHKIKTSLWSKILEITSSGKHYIIALDGTGFSMTNPSYHYLQRIDGKIPKKYTKLSATYDTRKKKFCSAKVRVIPKHDIKDAKDLLNKIKPKKIVADKAYDANWLHKYCYERNIETHIPLRKWGKPKHKNMSKRILAKKHFNNKTYHRRELIESGYGSVKRKFGSNIDSKKAKTIKADIYGKLICHNIFYGFIDF